MAWRAAAMPCAWGRSPCVPNNGLVSFLLSPPVHATACRLHANDRAETRPFRLLSVSEVRVRYDRAARWFDLAELPMELLVLGGLRGRL